MKRKRRGRTPSHRSFPGVKYRRDSMPSFCVTKHCFHPPRPLPPMTLSHQTHRSLTHISLSQTGGNGGSSGNASGTGGSGANITISANHHTTGGNAGSNSNKQTTTCEGSCVTYVIESATGGNGGSAADNGYVTFKGGNTNANGSGGSSVAGSGGNVSTCTNPPSSLTSGYEICPSDSARTTCRARPSVTAGPEARPQRRTVERAVAPATAG